MKSIRYFLIAFLIFIAAISFAQTDTTAIFKVYGVCAALCKPRIETAAKGIHKDAIIAADEPFSPYFDASLIWGPVTGRMLYAGMRFTIKRTINNFS